MNLSNGAITYEGIVSPQEIARLKRAGYKQVQEGEPAIPDASVERNVAIEKIYELCDEAGVKPEDLIIESANPTLVEIKRAIKAAKTAKKSE